jgi:hypothetical protein
MQYNFGSGVLWAIPNLSLSGAAVSNPTATQFGALQDVSVDMSFGKKELYGQYQWPLAVARGTGKVECKAKCASINASLMNQMFGMTPVTGQIIGVFQEAATLTASPKTITVAHAAQFSQDLGVTYAATGLPLTCVASSPAPTVGQYAVSNGVYTFSSADATALAGVLISYTYTTVASPGQNFIITNQLLGLAPYFAVVFNMTFQGQVFNLQLYQCVSTKLTLASKLEDFLIPEFDFSAMANSAGQIGSISLASQ